jgi:sec-independent protein translocase protein TatB
VFDVSFSELLVVAIVALLVIGPEKLPKVARTVGAFTGRMQRYMAQVKEEVNREMRFEELQKLQQEIKQSVNQEVASLQANIHAAPSDTDFDPPKPKRSVKSKVAKVAVSKPATPKQKAINTIIVKPKTVKSKRIINDAN